MFKHPKAFEAYHYMDKDTDLKKSEDDMYDPTSPLSRILDLFYKTEKEGKLTFAMWNDQPLGRSDKPKPWAHAKGLLAFDGTTGFWLTHSVPHFPSAPPQDSSAASYAATRKPMYAQDMLCISIDAEAFKTISKQLVIDKPYVQLEDGGAADGANMNDPNFKIFALDRVHPKKGLTVDSASAIVTSLGGQEFTMFAKSAYFDKDLFGMLVAPELKKDLITETWQKGATKNNMVSYCIGDYKVLNSKETNWPDEDDDKNDHWTETQDHSKWAVADDGTVFCIADINRQIPQTKRGGGATCIKDEKIASQIRNVIVKTQECPESMIV